MVQDSTMDASMDAMMDSMQMASDQAMEAYASSAGQMDAAAAGGIMALLMGYMVFLLGYLVLMVVIGWRIYSKAGQPGWACIVPIYNIIVLLRIVGKPWWWLLLMLLPIVNFILAIMVTHRLSKSFGYGVGFTLGMLFLGPIFPAILAFGSAKYLGPGGAPAQA